MSLILHFVTKREFCPFIHGQGLSSKIDGKGFVIVVYVASVMALKHINPLFFSVIKW